MKKILGLLMTIVLFGTVAVSPIHAETLISSPIHTEEIGTGDVVPVAYTSDFAEHGNIACVLNSDGTKTAYIFATAADAAQVDSITGLTSPSVESGAEVAAITPIQSSGIKIASVYSGAANQNFSSETTFSVGEHSQRGYARTYMQFDLSSLTNLKISYKDILSANLYFEQENYSIPTEGVVEAYFVKNTWEYDEITWTNRPDYYNGEKMGTTNLGAYDLLENSFIEHRNIYITKAVMAWMQGMNNYGIMLKEKDDALYGSFYSVGVSDTSLRPYLTVTYATEETPLGQGIVSGDKYYIVNRAMDAYLTASSASVGSNVYQANGNTSLNDLQTWKITAVAEGQYLITLGDAAVCLSNNIDDFSYEYCNEYSKNFEFECYNPDSDVNGFPIEKLVFHMQADADGNVYIVDFTAYDCGEH